MNLLTTTQAADALGLTPQRIRALIAAGRLPATQVGRDWLIDPQALATFAQQPRKAGRPPKACAS